MNIKNNFVKVTAAAALTITGVAAVNAVQSDSTTANVQAATIKVTINYVPGYGVNIWDNYNGGHFTGQRAQHGTTWEVLEQKFDSKGRNWYKIGENKWILAQYATTDASAASTKTANAATKKTTTTTAAANKTKKVKKSVQATGDASSVITLASAQVGKPYVYGAQGTDSFDCSGLTSYVYSKAAGVNIGRTTYDQVKQGTTVSIR